MYNFLDKMSEDELFNVILEANKRLKVILEEKKGAMENPIAEFNNNWGDIDEWLFD